MSKMIKIINGNVIEYEILPLVAPNDPILREELPEIDFDTAPGHEISYSAMSLMETLGKLEGLGLSANQVGLRHRIMALNMGEKIWCLCNPKVLSYGVGFNKYKEGCLTYPGLYLEIGRPASVTVQFQALNGDKITETFSGLTATCFLHELDHLNGIVFTDKVSPLKLQLARDKTQRNLKKIKKMKKMGAA